MASKLEGGGGKALMAWPLGDDFFSASLILLVKVLKYELTMWGCKVLIKSFNQNLK